MGRLAADVTILGSGAAGCAAALTLARGGCSVVMIAPARHRQDRVGETLSSGAEAVLRDLGVAGPFANGPHRPGNATYSAWDAPILAQRNAMLHADRIGHVLDRPAFERMLLDATSGTATLHVCGRVMDAVWDRDRWVLQLDSGGGELAARIVLDCSGRAATFAGRLSRRCRADRLVGAYGRLTQQNDEVEPSPATMIEAAADGWWHAVLLPNGQLSLGFFSDPDLLPRHLSRDVEVWRDMLRRTLFVQRWLESAGYAPDLPPRLESAGTTWLEPSSGVGWAAAGDAAAAFDPLSSHGLTTALWTGRQIALAALAALRSDERLILNYAATIREAVRNFLLERRAVYSRARRFSDRPFWQRRVISSQ